VEESTLWRDWVLVALADLPSSRAESERAVIEEVAIRFADRFGQDDRVFDADCPRWHGEIRKLWLPCGPSDWSPGRTHRM